MSETKHKGGYPPRKEFYATLAVSVPRAICRLLELIESRNEGVAVAAVKTLLNKVIPDLRAVELSGKDGIEAITVNLVRGFFSKPIKEACFDKEKPLEVEGVENE